MALAEDEKFAILQEPATQMDLPRFRVYGVYRVHEVYQVHRDLQINRADLIHLSAAFSPCTLIPKP